MLSTGSSMVLSDMVSDQQTTSSDSDTSSTPSSVNDDYGGVITLSSGGNNLDPGAKSKVKQVGKAHRVS